MLAWSLRRDGVLRALRDAGKHAHTSSSASAAAGAAIQDAHTGIFFASRIMRALQVGHDTISVFLGPADDPIPREFRAALLVSTLLVVLTVDVWMCAGWRRMHPRCVVFARCSGCCCWARRVCRARTRAVRKDFLTDVSAPYPLGKHNDINAGTTFAG